MYNGVNKITIHKLRISEMGFANINPVGKAVWQFIDLQDGNCAQVGKQYASKAELLADAENYIKSWGYQ